MDGLDELISMAEAAGLLGVHLSTLSKWLRQGRIRAFQYGRGGLYRPRRGDVLAYIEAKRIARDGGRAGPARGAEPEPEPDAT